MNWIEKFKKYKLKILLCLTIISLLVTSFYFLDSNKSKALVSNLNKNLNSTKKELNDLKNQDQVKINEKLREDIKSTHDAYAQTINLYEKIKDLKAQKQETKDMDVMYAQIIKYLSDLNFSSGSALITKTNTEVNKKYAAIAAVQISAPSTQTASVSNIPPGNGYSFQAVKTDAGTFNVSIIAADLK